MVSLTLKDCMGTRTSADDNVANNTNMILLDENQAAQVPFPTRCPVLVLDSKFNIVSSGIVTAVYVSFVHNTGSCHNYYSVATRDTEGTVDTKTVCGTLLRYAINCTIKVSARVNSANEEEAIDGVIKGFEIHSDNGVSGEIAPTFSYSVEVSAMGPHSEERVFRQRGISPKHIRYRKPSELETDSYYLDHEKSSVVSFDDASDGVKRLHNAAQIVFTSPLKSSSNCTNTSLASPAQVSSVNQFVSSPQPQIVDNNSDPKAYTKCTPLPPPMPTHFRGDFEKAQSTRIPDFSFLSNFPPSNMVSLPRGTKCCVMCGVERSSNIGKSSKTKSMKGLLSSSKDAVVIPNQNKGLCTLCDVKIWVVKESGLQIKWCKGCKNFQSWATFGEKGSATKCVKCRDRQREKYAASKKSEPAMIAGNKRKISLQSEIALKRA